MPGLLTSKELREKRQNLHNEYQSVLNKASDEGRELTSEDRQALDRMDERDAALKSDIERIEAHEARQAELAESRGLRGNGARPGVTDPPGGEEEERRSDGPSAEAVNAAFESYVRYGMSALTAEERAVMSSRFSTMSEGERRALGAGSDTAGGFTVPDEPMQRIVSAQLRYGGMRRAPTTQFTTATGAPIPIPTDNDTSNTGELLGENTQSNEQDITFGQATLNSYMYSSKIVRVSLQLLQDASVDLNMFVFDKLGVRLGRIQNTHFTTGDGSSKPQGVVTGATLGKTGASATDIAWDEITDLIHSVDEDYRDMDATAFMFSDDTLRLIKQIKDGNGRPLWQPSVQVGEPDRIDRYRYVVNNDVADIASSAKSILFGDWSKYFIRDVGGVQLLRLSERYADYLQVGFIAFRRGDGLLVDAGTRPIKYFQNAA
jgi:HK97 family phage major capsid protein